MEKILFVREVSNSPGLYITDESGAEPELFLQDEISFVSCSPGGELFALLLLPISPDLDSHYVELLLIDLVSSKYKVFSAKSLGPFDYARCSPSGKCIVFHSERPKGRGSPPQLFLVKPDSDKIFQLTSEERGAMFPNWVSDDHICFDLCRSGGWHSLDMKSGAIKALDFLDDNATHVCATPNGRQIFWVTSEGYDSKSYAIASCNIDTGQKKKVFVADYMMTGLLPYPNGSRILYTAHSVTSHGRELHLLDLADGRSVRLTNLENRESVIDHPACVLENWSEVSMSPVWREIKEYIESRKNNGARLELVKYSLQVSGWKLVFMLLITWLTPFSGLGNLIFLWNDLHYRKKAAVALGISLVAVMLHIISVFALGSAFIYVFDAIQLGMDIWMTIDAINAYKKYHL